MITRAPRISPKKKSSLVQCFLSDTNAVQAAELSRVSRPCANRWYRHFREIIYAASRRAPRFEGEVEIDIGYFSGRSSKKSAAMIRRLAGLPAASIVAQRRHIAKTEGRKQPILGILRRGGDLYLHPIMKKDRRTLEPIIRLVVEKGATIYTDQEKGLANLHLDTYVHQSVNHSLSYSLKNGVHINGIESCWSECRRRMARNFKGVPRSTMLLHIKECEFRFNHRHDLKKAFIPLLKASL